MGKSGMTFAGQFHIRCYQKPRNAFEWMKWAVFGIRKLKWEEKTQNLVTNEGLNAGLNIMFHGATQITTWYICPFEDNHTPAAGDSYATPGYTECTAYDEANRPAFVENAASSQSIDNTGNRAVFTFNATKTIYGMAMVGGGTGANTKGDTAGGGTLWCASQFASSKSVNDDDVIEVTYTINAADDGS